jgi:hypothetical protein
MNEPIFPRRLGGQWQRKLVRETRSDDARRRGLACALLVEAFLPRCEHLTNVEADVLDAVGETDRLRPVAVGEDVDVLARLALGAFEAVEEWLDQVVVRNTASGRSVRSNRSSVICSQPTGAT